MNRIEAVAAVSLAALIVGGLGRKYGELSKLAATPPPSKDRRQTELRPVRTVDSAIASYLYNAGSPSRAQDRQLGLVLAALESPEFDGERSTPSPPKPGQDRRRAREAATAGRRMSARPSSVPGRPRLRKTSRLRLKRWRMAPRDTDEALKRVGSPLGVRGSSVYAKVRELGEKGLVPDAVYPAVLRRTGGVKAKDVLVTLMTSTDSSKLIAGCAISLQDYRDPELIGKILERLEAVGMIDSAGKMPWISPALLDEHLKSADKASFRRGMMAMATRPGLVKTGIVHVEKGLQNTDADTRRYAAVAVKKAVVTKMIDAKQGEALLAGRLQVETEPVLKAELTGGLERIHSLLEQKETGVQ